MTTTDVVPVAADPVPRYSDVPTGLAEQMHLARALAGADLLPRHLRGKPADILVVLQGARALNVPGFWALQSMYVVDGRLTLSADLMRGIVARAGHAVRVVERTAQRATVEIKRTDRATPYRATFTIAEATTAGLAGKDNWRHYPAAMLVARATTIAVREECPDLLFGMVYSPEELGATVDEEGVPIVDGEIVDDPPADPPAQPEARPVDRDAAIKALNARADAAGLTAPQRQKRLWAAFGSEHLHQLSDGQLREAWRVLGNPEPAPAGAVTDQPGEATADADRPGS